MLRLSSLNLKRSYTWTISNWIFFCGYIVFDWAILVLAQALENLAFCLMSSTSIWSHKYYFVLAKATISSSPWPFEARTSHMPHTGTCFPNHSNKNWFTFLKINMLDMVYFCTLASYLNIANFKLLSFIARLSESGIKYILGTLLKSSF